MTEADPNLIESTWDQLDRMLTWLEERDPRFGLRVHLVLNRPARTTLEPPDGAPSPGPKAWIRSAPRLLQ